MLTAGSIDLSPYLPILGSPVHISNEVGMESQGSQLLSEQLPLPWLDLSIHPPLPPYM